jgi:hypothetical protein
VGGTRIMPKGKFSQPAFGSFEAMAYVAGDGVTEFITRSVYRARGYMPPFEELPSQDEYEAAEEENQDIEADEAANVALALHQLEFLSIAMGRFGENSDARRDFIVDCGDRLNIAPGAATTSIAVPEDIWEYWLLVSRGTNDDYDERGNRVAEE